MFVDPVTGTIYHTEGRPSEGGRNAIVFTETGRDAMRKKWDARTRVHEVRCFTTPSVPVMTRMACYTIVSTAVPQRRLTMASSTSPTC